jgi:hypothetical protein
MRVQCLFPLRIPLQFNYINFFNTRDMKNSMNLKAILLLIVMFCPVLLMAQNKDSLSTSAKIDSIYNMQKKMYSESKNEPLSNKKYGVEINLFRLLSLGKATTFSGSFSLFDVNRKSEISFPVYYQNPQSSDDLTEFTLDCHYRYFLGNTQNGFYLSGFARYAFLHGTLGDDYMFSPETPGIKGSESKLGIGFGLGYRIFSYKGLYWGVSASFGRYIIGKSNRFSGSFLSVDDDSEFIFDVELLKFGWAF